MHMIARSIYEKSLYIDLTLWGIDDLFHVTVAKILLCTKLTETTYRLEGREYFYCVIAYLVPLAISSKHDNDFVMNVSIWMVYREVYKGLKGRLRFSYFGFAVVLCIT